jgi:hypothetical protein
MPLLHETGRGGSFELTPDYNMMMAQWALIHPECPDPRFNDTERDMLVFHWPHGVSPGATKRAANGRFATKNG